MAILHTVNKSPFSHNTLQSCLAVLQTGDTLLLIEDGIYGCLPTAATFEELQRLHANGVKLRVLKEDLEARGCSDQIDELFETADYNQFVELCTQHQSVQSWY